MCGIFGIWERGGGDVNLRDLELGTTALTHRGPDDEGYLLIDTRTGRTAVYGGRDTHTDLPMPKLATASPGGFDLGFGFRRLAILDTSLSGHQPMSSADGRFWLIYNGEIYNYRELREELRSRYVFKTGTDTEVILAAYAEWGPSCLDRFNGMWAFALWDSQQRHLFLARDRFGVKPLVISRAADRLVFGSEPKALLCAGVPFTPDEAVLAGYVAHGRLAPQINGKTFFHGIEQLPAATAATVTRDAWRTTRYWQLPKPAEEHSSTALRVAEHRELFVDAVRLRLRSDVPVGSCLSGGLDSSSIVTSMAQVLKAEHAVQQVQQKTFSAVYGDGGRWDESKYIDMVVQATGAEAHRVVPTGDRLLREVEDLVWHQDEPFQSTSIFAQWCVMASAAEQGVVVMLDGQGADELYAGYGPYDSHISGLLRGGRLLQAARVLRLERQGAASDIALKRLVALQLPASAIRRLRLKHYERASAAAGLGDGLAASLGTAQAEADADWQASGNLHSHLSRLVEEQTLPNLLRYEDRNSMAFSREARVPFLDYRVVEHAFRDTPDLRIRDGWTKWVHRQAVTADLPQEVAWRRDKVGFETPERQWLAAAADRWVDLLSGDGAGGYITMHNPKEAVRTSLAAGGDTRLLWRQINVALWLSVVRSRVARARR